MSVLIKGMAIPKDCRECPLQEYYGSSGNTLCFPTDKYLAEKYNPIGFEGRANWCPLVEVKPHGRLIDADALIKALVRKEPFNDCARVVIAECMEEVRHAPTVIEAEDGT